MHWDFSPHQHPLDSSICKLTLGINQERISQVLENSHENQKWVVHPYLAVHQNRNRLCHLIATDQSLNPVIFQTLETISL